MGGAAAWQVWGFSGAPPNDDQPVLRAFLEGGRLALHRRWERTLGSLVRCRFGGADGAVFVAGAGGYVEEGCGFQHL